MTQQAQILAQMQEIIMSILKTGDLKPEDGEKMDALEMQLHQQKCFTPSGSSEYEYLGEEIAALFHKNEFDAAMKKLRDSKIEPIDFFGFAEYHFEDDEDTEMFDGAFMRKVDEAYRVS